VWGGRSGFAVEEFARRHGDFAIAGATVAVALDDDGHVQRCGIGLLGLGSTPLRGSAAESAVIGEPVHAVAAEDVGRLAIEGLSEIPVDLQGSAQYRSRVGTAMVARAWAAAVRQAEMSKTEAIHA
jgi:carbon-monoxide dehydrogenase medium subunit